MLPQLQDVLDYHIIPSINVGATPISGVKATLLKSAVEQAGFCTAPAPATVELTAAGGSVTFTDAAGTVANATVRGSACNGIIYDIDAVLLPCGIKDSIVATFLASQKPVASPAKSPAAGSKSPAPGTPAGNASATPSAAPKGSAAPMMAASSWTAAVLAASLVAILVVSQ